MGEDKSETEQVLLLQLEIEVYLMGNGNWLVDKREGAPHGFSVSYHLSNGSGLAWQGSIFGRDLSAATCLYWGMHYLQ